MTQAGLSPQSPVSKLELLSWDRSYKRYVKNKNTVFRKEEDKNIWFNYIDIVLKMSK